MKKSKLSFLLVMVLGLFLVLAGCAGDGSTNNTADNGNTNDAGDTNSGETAGSDDYLVIAVGADAVSLDPHKSNDVPSSNVRENIYETLVKQDENLEIVAGLAESWEPVDDTTWKFKLQEGVKFHDGSDFTAEDVKATLDRVRDPAVASDRAFLFDMITEVIVDGDYEITIKTEYPFAPLLAHLTHDGGGIMSSEVIEQDYANAIEKAGLDITVEEYYELREAGGAEYDEVLEEIGQYLGEHIAQNPIGTGFFELEDRVADDRTTLKRFEDYWGEKAKLPGVVFKVVPDASARVNELETGYSHVADAIQPTDKEYVDSHDETYVNVQESVSLSYISFNVNKEPFDDPRVRQAISMAINKQEIIDGIYQGNGIPAVGPLAPDVFGYDPDVSGLPYDPERAKELLEEAGYGDGFSTTIWTNDNEQRVETAVYVQNALKELNIDVEIEELEWGAYLDRTANGEHDMFILGWSTVTADADYGLYALLHSSQHGSAGNRSFIADEELDRLLDEGRRETDPDKRLEIYSEAQELLVELAPMIYIHHQNYLTGVRNEVKDFWVDALGIYKLQDAYIEQ